MRGRSLSVSHLKALIKSKVRERVFLVATTFEIAVRMNEADLFVIGEGIFAQHCRFHKFIDESITFWWLNRTLVCIPSNSHHALQRTQLISIKLPLVCKRTPTVLVSHPMTFLQKEIQSDKNDTRELINISNSRAMDACEIANFLASELFMHQVRHRPENFFWLASLNFILKLGNILIKIILILCSSWTTADLTVEWAESAGSQHERHQH